MASSGSTYIPWNKVTETVPQGAQVPMCFCGFLCKLMKSRVLGDDFGKRFFMCENYEFRMLQVREPPLFTNQRHILFIVFYTNSITTNREFFSEFLVKQMRVGSGAAASQIPPTLICFTKNSEKNSRFIVILFV